MYINKTTISKKEMKGGRKKEGLMGEFRLDIKWKKCHHTCASVFV